MKKILLGLIGGIILLFSGYLVAAYNITYSEGTRSGELIKFSKKGVLFKTFEGEISQGISGAQIFKFSVEENQPIVIEKLHTYQGKYVKVRYKERFTTFPWLGDTHYYITNVDLESSPHFNK